MQKSLIRVAILLSGLTLLVACGEGQTQTGQDLSEYTPLTRAEEAVYSEYLYERVAQRPLTTAELEDPNPETPINEAIDVVLNQTADAIIAAIQADGTSFLAVGTNGQDRIPYPPVQNMDGTMAYGVGLELFYAADGRVMDSMDQGIGLPWVIGIYADHGVLAVDVGVPETYTRIYFPTDDERDAERKKTIAVRAHAKMQRVIQEALGDMAVEEPFGVGIEMPDWSETAPSIAGITYLLDDLAEVAPSVTLNGDYEVAQVVAALEGAFFQSSQGMTTPDLDGDGNFQEELPEGFAAYMGMMPGMSLSCDEMNDMMSMGLSMPTGDPGLWVQGGTFQAWKNIRTVNLTVIGNGPLYIMELCQPFYAGAALSTGMYHLTAMPCNIAIWKESGKIKVSVLNPNVIFGYFFADAMQAMQADPNMAPMLQLFGMFPTFVLNELMALANNGLQGLGEGRPFEYWDIPYTCQ
jgi:hypothetical protein